MHDDEFKDREEQILQIGMKNSRKRTHLGQILLRADLVVQANDADVLLTSALLRLDQASGTVHAHNQIACSATTKETEHL